MTQSTSRRRKKQRDTKDILSSIDVCQMSIIMLLPLSLMRECLWVWACNGVGCYRHRHPHCAMQESVMNRTFVQSNDYTRWWHSWWSVISVSLEKAAVTRSVFKCHRLSASEVDQPQHLIALFVSSLFLLCEIIMLSLTLSPSLPFLLHLCCLRNWGTLIDT